MSGVVRLAVVGVLLAVGPASAQDKKPDVLLKLEGHRGGIGSVAFGPKGEFIATGAGNGVVRLWNAKTGDIVFKGDDTAHGEARVTLVAFSGDGKAFSSASKKAVLTWDISDPKFFKFRHEDGLLANPSKTGTVTGDGKRVYYTGSINNVYGLRVYSLGSREDSTVAVPEKLRPVALAAIPDAESGLVAVYGTTGEKSETAAIALVGLGDPKLLAEDVPVAGGKAGAQIAFSTDGKWLVVGNGTEAVYWRVPGSQVITGKPTKLKSGGAAVAAGPGNRIAVASSPEEGKKAKVMLYEISTADAKVVAEFATEIERVSVLAFSPDGTTLAVGDDAEGVLQLWALDKK